MKEEQNTEQAILKAAENEFLEKGYSRSKTIEIAQAAGVTHAMLHYYFRTKENLFNKVFQDKVRLMASTFTSMMNEDLPFMDRISKGVEKHFDLVAQNKKLPIFIISEVLGNEERREACREIFLPVIQDELSRLQVSIDKEISKGSIQKITAINLLMSIVSLNVFVFIATPVLRMMTGNSEAEYNKFLADRKKENIETILSRLRI